MQCDFSEFPGCCGAFVLHDFFTSSWDENRGKYKPGYLLDRMQKCIEYHGEPVEYISYKYLFTIVLNDDQMYKDSSLEPILSEMKELGFERVSSWVNSNTGNICNLFICYYGNSNTKSKVNY